MVDYEFLKKQVNWDTDKDISNALVSIVTPTYNRRDLLYNSVNCILEQEYGNIEHIIVGDNCPVLNEETPKLLKVNPKLRIYNPKFESRFEFGSANIARVRNYGIQKATGDFIGHLDDDNTFDPNHISSLIKTFQRVPQAAVAYSYRKLLIDGSEPYVYPYSPWPETIEGASKQYQAYKRMGIFQEGSHLMKDRISMHEETGCTLDTNELFVRKEVHERFLFRTEYTDAMHAFDMAEDDAFCIDVYLAGYRVACSGEFTLNFRVGGRYTEVILNHIKSQHGQNE